MKLKYAVLALIICALTGCRGAKEPVAEVDKTEAAELIVGGDQAVQGSKYLPMARIYRTTGDYNEYVPVTLNAEGTAIVSYPAPSDLTEYSTPVKLADGWLLDRRGITPNSAFTRYTYEQYRELSAPPSLTELMASIIPGARVAEIVELPMTTSAAEASLPEIDKMIESGLEGCKVLYTLPHANP